MNGKRIALVGGTSYESHALDDFLWKLAHKYPHATIVTGSQRGSEKHAAESCQMLGMKVETPDEHPEWFGKEASACQVNDVLIGADIIITIGSPTAGRAKIARDWWLRMQMMTRDARGSLVKDKAGNLISKREKWNRIQLVNVAAPPKAAPKPRAKKPKAMEAMA